MNHAGVRLGLNDSSERFSKASESCGVTPMTKKKAEMMEKMREKKAKRETFGEFLTPHGVDQSLNHTIHTQ